MTRAEVLAWCIQMYRKHLNWAHWRGWRGTAACNVDGKVEKEWNYFSFFWLVIIVFFQNIPDSQQLSQQATRWANATDDFHGLKQHRHGESRPVESKRDEKDSSAATSGIRNQDVPSPRWPLLQTYGFWPLFCLETRKSVCSLLGGKVWEGKQRGLLLRVMQLDSWSHGRKMLQRPQVISQRGLHVALRGWGHFLLGSSRIVNVFRKPESVFVFWRWIFLLAVGSE